MVKSDNKEEIEELQEKIDKLQEEKDAYESQDSEKEDAFDEFLDDVYGEVNVAGYSYETSRLLKSIDSIAYQEGFSSWADGEITRIEEEMDDLKDQIKELKEE